MSEDPHDQLLLQIRGAVAEKAGMKRSDVRQIQWDFNQTWHRQFLLKPCRLTANLVIGETSRASHAKQSIGAHKILWRHGNYGRALSPGCGGTPSGPVE